MGQRSNAQTRERYGVDSDGWDGFPIPRDARPPPLYKGYLGVAPDGGGNWSGFLVSVYGTLTPNILEGIGVQQLRVSTANDKSQIRLLAGVEIPSIGQGDINISYEGFKNNPVLHSWDVAGTKYQSEADAALTSFLSDSEGSQIGVVVEQVGIYAGQLTVDTDGTNFGFITGNYGALVPNDIEGVIINQLVAVISNNRLVLITAGGVTIPSVGVGTIDVYLEGYQSNPVEMEWNVGTTRYQSAADVALSNYLTASLGRTIAVYVT